MSLGDPYTSWFVFKGKETNGRTLFEFFNFYSHAYRGLCCQKMSVCLSVCLSECPSVTFRYCVKTAKRTVSLILITFLIHHMITSWHTHHHCQSPSVTSSLCLQLISLTRSLLCWVGGSYEHPPCWPVVGNSPCVSSSECPMSHTIWLIHEVTHVVAGRFQPWYGVSQYLSFTTSFRQRLVCWCAVRLATDVVEDGMTTGDCGAAEYAQEIRPVDHSSASDEVIA